MLSGVVIEKIQAANKVNASYKDNDDPVNDDENRVRTESKAPELYVRL